MKKLTMHTKDLTQDYLAKIRTLFPHCVTETHDAQGQISLAIDFDLFKQELSDAFVTSATKTLMGVRPIAVIANCRNWKANLTKASPCEKSTRLR